MLELLTFHDLGIPFPLFEAPVSDATDYEGRGRCSLCHKEDVHCFRLGIGADVVVRCSGCTAEVALDADSRSGGACQACQSHVEFPDVDPSAVLACYACLRGGRAALTKVTELGMIRHENAVRGVTCGEPGLNSPGFDLVPLTDGWVGARLPTPTMLELVRTPGYSTIQGERWRFCCKMPMAYVGEWSREKFSEMAPDGNGREFFHQTVHDAIDGLWEDRLHDATGIYVFRCAMCRKYSAHWDMFQAPRRTISCMRATKD
jgi:hypothetical protein